MEFITQHQITGSAIGTQWTIDIEDQLSTSNRKKILVSLNNCVERFDALYSRFRDDSTVMKLAKKKGTYSLFDDGLEMLQLYEKLYRLSNGAFTPLIAGLLEEAGYDSSYSFNSQTLHSLPTWDEAILLTESGIRFKDPVVLDFGALGKGKLIDQIGLLLENHGIISYCIDGSGDILYKDTKALKVGLEHPTNTEQIIGIVEIQNNSICASSGNRRKWGNYHHIMNPLTLRPVEDVLSTWVIAKSAMEADALATCLFFVQPEELEKHFSFQYLILYPDFSVKKSQAFPGELYYTT